MKVIGETDRLPQGSTVATIGMFDGVHLGHATLIDFLKQQASAQGKQSLVITFLRHPRQVLRPDESFGLIMPLADRLSQLDSKKTAIITQYVNGVVVPTYKSLADEANELATLCQELRDNPTQSKVQECCNKWISARKYWELSEAFLFGAAADYNIDPHIDSWPLQKSQLDNILNNDALIAALDEDGAKM